MAKVITLCRHLFVRSNPEKPDTTMGYELSRHTVEDGKRNNWDTETVQRLEKVTLLTARQASGASYAGERTRMLVVP